MSFAIFGQFLCAKVYFHVVRITVYWIILGLNRRGRFKCDVILGIFFKQKSDLALSKVNHKIPCSFVFEIGAGMDFRLMVGVT